MPRCMTPVKSYAEVGFLSDKVKVNTLLQKFLSSYVTIQFNYQLRLAPRFFIQSQSEFSENDTNKQSDTQKSPPWASDRGMRRSLRRTFFRPEDATPPVKNPKPRYGGKGKCKPQSSENNCSVDDKFGPLQRYRGNQWYAVSEKWFQTNASKFT